MATKTAKERWINKKTVLTISNRWLFWAGFLILVAAVLAWLYIYSHPKQDQCNLSEDTIDGHCLDVQRGANSSTGCLPSGSRAVCDLPPAKR